MTYLFSVSHKQSHVCPLEYAESGHTVAQHNLHIYNSLSALASEKKDDRLEGVARANVLQFL